MQPLPLPAFLMPSPPPPTSIPGVFLDPFLAVVRSPETSGPITTVALQALGRFCAAGLVVGAGAGRALNDLARAVVECRFDPTNAAMDEVVLSHILRTLRAAVTCTVGHTLSDEMVCEIMQTCFRLCFQVRVLFFFFFLFGALRWRVRRAVCVCVALAHFSPPKFLF